MSEKLRSRLRKRGRGCSSDDEDICAYFNLTSDLLGKDIGEEWPNVEVPKRKYQSTVINDDDVHSGISSDVSQLKWNTAWKAMAVKSRSELRMRRKTLIDSGCNRTIFTNRLLFSDFQECLIPITTAGEEVYATGIGTVGKLKGCLYVPNMNVNLISVMHVLDDIPNVSVTFEKPNGVGICFIRHKLQQFEEVVCETKNRLVEVTNFQWLGLDGLDEEALLERYYVKASRLRANYFAGIAIQGMEEEIAVLMEEKGASWVTNEKIGLIHKAYLAKADAMELLHSQLGHMPYPRIERMIRRGIIKGVTLDKKTLKALQRERCHVCMRSKKTDAAHNGHIPVASSAWVNFQTDITAMFDQASLYGNNYMMVIIDTKSKYVWDYYLKTKDEAFDKICEWLEKEVGLHRGRESANYEITLFSDQGEAHSKKVEEACRRYGVLKQSTGGYTPQHNAFAERWFRTISEMSSCQMLQFDSPEALWEDSRRMATFIYNRVPPVRLTPGENWEPPIKKQYPTRSTMDLTRLQPFGIKCWVYQKKPIRDRSYAGKSDKKERSKEGILVGYSDSHGLRYIFLAQVVLSGTPRSWLRLPMHCTRWSRRTRNQLRRIWGRNQSSTSILW